jgi:uncharacterized protein YdeI (YjbR/CyaY-like superfamily)
MVLSFITYTTVSEFKAFIEQNILETKSELGTQLTQIGNARKKYEEAKKRGATSGKKDVKQMEVAGFKVLVNPTEEHELTLMEESFSSMEDKLDAFERAKELYHSLTNENTRIGIVLEDGVPTAFMLYQSK